jgi:hypothetical protein
MQTVFRRKKDEILQIRLDCFVHVNFVLARFATPGSAIPEHHIAGH